MSIRRRLVAVIAGASLLIALSGGVAAGSSGADPARCGTPFEAPGQECPAVPDPTPEPTPEPPSGR